MPRPHEGEEGGASVGGAVTRPGRAAGEGMMRVEGFTGTRGRFGHGVPPADGAGHGCWPGGQRSGGRRVGWGWDGGGRHAVVGGAGVVAGGRVAVVGGLRASAPGGPGGPGGPPSPDGPGGGVVGAAGTLFGGCVTDGAGTVGAVVVGGGIVGVVVGAGEGTNPPAATSRLATVAPVTNPPANVIAAAVSATSRTPIPGYQARTCRPTYLATSEGSIDRHHHAQPGQDRGHRPT